MDLFFVAHSIHSFVSKLYTAVGAIGVLENCINHSVDAWRWCHLNSARKVLRLCVVKRFADTRIDCGGARRQNAIQIVCMFKCVLKALKL